MKNTDLISPAAKTIRQFCVSQQIGLTSYYKLRKQGLTPKELRLGRVVRITAEAEREWLERMQTPTMEVL
jgi:predicted DNA-binding transcriptional regulator AlpA